MPDRLPPLTALRAFEAAARRLSFANAADELSVTPAALSFQIKALEEHLGHPLFHRHNRKVTLTEAGRALAPGAEDGFRALATAWRAAQRVADSHGLTVTAGPAFTAKWMAPRFYEFAREHPDIELRFSATLRYLDFAQDDVDVAIRFGTGPYDGVYALPMANEWLTPVMTPALAKRFPTPESLRTAPLLIDESLDFLKPPCDWPAWFRAVGVTHDSVTGPHFSQADHAIDAALAGAGVVLGRRALVIKDLYDGRLVAPYKLAIQANAQFHFVCRENDRDKPAIAALRDWMLSEIEKTAPISDAMTIVSH